jgi:H+/Cl- antiporter ClcA
MLHKVKNKHIHTFPLYVINGFFFGLLSAIAFRSIIVFQRLEPAWVRPVWYVGVVGYIGFFLYRYSITRKRKHAIREYALIEKVQANACLTEDDREVVIYLLSSIKKSHEDMNYLFIFILSIIAILIDILFSLYT